MRRLTLIAAAVVSLLVVGCASAPLPPPQPTPPTPPLSAPTLPHLGALFGLGCYAEVGFGAAAHYNDAAQGELVFSPFGRLETGWAVYEPLAAETLQTHCAPDSQGFAKAVSAWQSAHGLPPDGALTPETFQTLKGVWQERRPFIMLRVAGICPAGADEAGLETLRPNETFGDKPVMLRPLALAALRRMAAAARQEAPEAAADPALLTAFSGYRSPDADLARCGREHNCQGMVRAQCSAHRTGLAVDLNVGFAPGFMADASADANRLYQSRTETYRWLVRNAARFGFVNYPFEPWHWEWTGEAPS